MNKNVCKKLTKKKKLISEKENNVQQSKSCDLRRGTLKIM